MTARKPAGEQWQSWIDRQITDAQSKGAFENLAGKGKPLEGLDEPYDELWWVKGLMRREKVGNASRTLELRHRVEQWLDTYIALPSVFTLKRQAQKLNEEIQVANKGELGPMLPQPLLKIEELCIEWHRHNKHR